METFEERKLEAIRLLEAVVRGEYGRIHHPTGEWVEHQFISPNSIDLELPPAPRGQPTNTEVRNAAIADSDAQDVAAGRPLLTSVVVDPVTMLPRKGFFRVLCERDAVEAKTEEDKARLHTQEYHRALAFPWETVDR